MRVVKLASAGGVAGIRDAKQIKDYPHIWFLQQDLRDHVYTACAGKHCHPQSLTTAEGSYTQGHLGCRDNSNAVPQVCKKKARKFDTLPSQPACHVVSPDPECGALQWLSTRIIALLCAMHKAVRFGANELWLVIRGWSMMYGTHYLLCFHIELETPRAETEPPLEFFFFCYGIS